MRRFPKLVLSALLALLLIWTATTPGMTAASSNASNASNGRPDLSSGLSISARLHAPTTAEINPEDAKGFLAAKAATPFESLRAENTHLDLALSLAPEAEGATDLTVTAQGTLTLSRQAQPLENLHGNLSWFDTKSGPMLHGLIRGLLQDETHIVLTTTYNPRSNQVWVVAFIGTINSESGILTFGTPSVEATKDLPEAIDKGREAKYGPQTPADEITTQSHCSPNSASYETPPDPANQGNDYRGRRLQRITSACGYRLGAIMLWAPNTVGVGQGRMYGARVWSDTAGATAVFKDIYGSAAVYNQTASVYAVDIGLTANPGFPTPARPCPSRDKRAQASRFPWPSWSPRFPDVPGAG